MQKLFDKMSKHDPAGPHVDSKTLKMTGINFPWKEIFVSHFMQKIPKIAPLSELTDAF